MRSFNERIQLKTTLKMTGCAAPFRTVLLLINGVFILIALGLIGLAVYGYVHFHPLGQVVSTDIPTGVLLVAVLMLTLSLIGFIGTYKNNRCLLMIYLVVLLILLACQTVVAFLAHHDNGDDVATILREGWVKAAGTTAGQNGLNLIQAELCCCGFNNSADYPIDDCNNSTTIIYSGSGSGSESITCDNGNGTWTGCGALLTSKYSTPMKVITGVSFTVAGLEALAVLFTFILFFCISCCSWEEEEIDPYKDPYDSVPLMGDSHHHHHRHHSRD